MIDGVLFVALSKTKNEQDKEYTEKRGEEDDPIWSNWDAAYTQCIQRMHSLVLVSAMSEIEKQNKTNDRLLLLVRCYILPPYW